MKELLKAHGKIFNFKNDPMLGKLTHVPDEPYEMQRDEQVEDEVEQMMLDDHDCRGDDPDSGCRGCMEILNAKK
ncbi:MAG TPA: hypothetical protein VMY59_04850 [Candidatus Thermoplasmatota archaeon]|nr:hypothetical protein [Candidatus Thermoplasmatota archaeon]